VQLYTIGMFAQKQTIKFYYNYNFVLVVSDIPSMVWKHLAYIRDVSGSYLGRFQLF